jgi:hypothetical protein
MSVSTYLEKCVMEGFIIDIHDTHLGRNAAPISLFSRLAGFVFGHRIANLGDSSLDNKLRELRPFNRSSKKNT